MRLRRDLQTSGRFLTVLMFSSPVTAFDGTRIKPIGFFFGVVTKSNRVLLGFVRIDLYCIFCTPRVYGYGFRINPTSNRFRERSRKHVLPYARTDAQFEYHLVSYPKSRLKTGQFRITTAARRSESLHNISLRRVWPKTNFLSRRQNFKVIEYISRISYRQIVISNACGIIFYITSERPFRSAKAIRSRMLVC